MQEIIDKINEAIELAQDHPELLEGLRKLLVQAQSMLLSSD